MSSAPMERESAHILQSHEFTYSNSMLNQPEKASAWLPAWLTGLHSEPAPPFCVSQETAPSILCLPSLTRSSPFHFVPHSRQPPPFYAFPPSQEMSPSILCLPSLTRNAPLHFVPSLPHKKQPPPFCVFPPSQEAVPSILCLSSLTRSSPLHFVPPLPHRRQLPPSGQVLGRVCTHGMAVGMRQSYVLTLPAQREIVVISLLLTPLTFWVQTLNIQLLQSYSIFIPHSAPTALNWVLK